MTEEYKNDFFTKLVFPPNTPLGDNTKTIEKLWEIFSTIYPCTDEIGQNIITNFLLSRDTIQFFPSKNGSHYLYTFNALEIDPKADNLASLHEIGHYLFNTLKIPVNNLENFNRETQAHIKNTANLNFTLNNELYKEANFKTLIIAICNSKNKAILAPLSDIISSIYLGVNNFKTKDGQTFTLPYSHPYNYYHQKDKTNYYLSFDEQFANFFALYMTNNQELLQIAKIFFGEQWYQTMTNILIQIEQILLERKEQLTL